ncbi:conserved hypothetical protein [Vibrio nigripulchritudo SFn27]|uniref:DUF72 domain-containing protein n=1 Tax=Vibrio nigripulchritudo TaxID=28173 RepID=UPI0003B20908|nr:DUF72 domain-containing protein [Vibrio nigripulchritudo]CCN89908.1 conserved hypothetical protein [Vibrio nigripulchritudo SFn27]
MQNLPLRLGLTMWSHSAWQAGFYGSGTQNSERLEKYARVFHTVEGNTTFYATPSASTVQNWRAATHDDFRFTFKLPKSITHDQKLRGCEGLLKDFMAVMQPIHDRVGMWTIQLPAQFGPRDLPALRSFCRLFPKEFPLGVEVRHLDFFNKGKEEQELNRWLHEEGIDRIIMDSRPVHSAEPVSDAVIDAHKKKPKVPAHAVSTSNRPMIRFIGHPELEANLPFFQPWIKKLPDWIAEGKQPYLMIHTPDNNESPEFARRLYGELQKAVELPELAHPPALSDNKQISMF